MNKQYHVSENLEFNLHLLQNRFFNEVDDLYIRTDDQCNFAIIYLHTMVDQTILDRDILPVLYETSPANTPEEMFVFLKQKAIPVGDTRQVHHLDNVVQALVQGQVVILMKGIDCAFLTSALNNRQRPIDDPKTEPALRGPKDAFIENVDTNVALLRQRIHSPLLKIKKYTLGTITQTRIVMVYLEHAANAELIEELKKRIENIHVDAFVSSYQLIEFLQDHPNSLFPTLASTERPDKIEFQLIDGGFAVMVDGTPFVIYGPIQFLSLLKAPDDYYFTFWLSSAIRILRLGAVLISLLLPSFYIALTSFHQEMIPTKLAINLSSGREPIPFPSMVEVLLMEGTFELLREAALRMPKLIGNAISIVGALVIGEAAVNAGIISPMMVIIVSITAIASFAIPDITLGITTRVLKFVFIGLAGFLGFFGISWGLMLLFAYLTGLRSFGVPYLTPLAPFILRDWKDTLLRFPLRNLAEKPTFAAPEESLRRQFSVKKRRR
ncbi:spore germination protein [Cohnella sp. CFH 77786]|uniref:spore germination protein n=1 Tax=Cohnella sp. CFH 77786 TaxID=2662265 RepID=UPI001C61022D|nr:spore germination protein [Cohnella sp. CFH 77786]MBW5449319.1 spore germination protein [Cohnella sp. CFH 77786]